jgi:hypothetical protein
VACFVASHGSAQSSGRKAQPACGVSLDLVRTEWRAPCKNLEGHYSNGPDVHSFRVDDSLAPRVSTILESALHLRSHVERRASTCVCLCVTVDRSFAKTEVGEFHPALRSGSDYQNVLTENTSAGANPVALMGKDIRPVSDPDA